MHAGVILLLLLNHVFLKLFTMKSKLVRVAEGYEETDFFAMLLDRTYIYFMSDTKLELVWKLVAMSCGD